MRRRAWMLSGGGLAAIAAAGVLAACGSSSSSSSWGGGSASNTASSKSPVVVGTSLSLSGDFSADGQAFQRGYQLWASDINKTGGLLGHPVKLDIVSDASSPAQVVTNYNKLIASDHAKPVFG